MATLNIRIDDTVKTDAQRVLDEIGLSMSNAITIYLTQIARLRAIPFRLSAELEPTDELIAAVNEAREEIRLNRNPSALIGKDELKDYLKGLRK
jgi:DNA-damage-inducible protein J